VAWTSREDRRDQEKSYREHTDPQPSLIVKISCDAGALNEADESGTQKRKRRQHDFHPCLPFAKTRGEA
jgi:hypothetical protein